MTPDSIGVGLGEGLPGGPRPRRATPAPSYVLTEDTPVYVISVAAELSGLHPQTLRQYDRLGLVCPDRTAGAAGAIRPGTSSSCARCSGSPRTRASTWRASSGSSSWRTRSPPCSPGSPNWRPPRGRRDHPSSARSRRPRVLPPRPGPVPAGPAVQCAGGLAAPAVNGLFLSPAAGYPPFGGWPAASSR